MTLIRAIQVNQRIQRIDGSYADAERAIETARSSGGAAIYLFDALDERGYERKKEEWANPHVLIERFAKHPFKKP